MRLKSKKKTYNSKSSVSNSLKVALNKGLAVYIDQATPQQLKNEMSLVLKIPTIRAKLYSKKNTSGEGFFSHSMNVRNDIKFWTWSIYYLLYRSFELKQYLLIEDKLLACVLRSNWKEALEIIECIEIEFGMSLKISKIKANIMNNLDGSADQYISSIDGAIVRHIIEKNVKRSGADELFEYNLERHKSEILNSSLPTIIKQILEYHLFPPGLSKAYSSKIVASIELYNSVVDLYDFICNEFNYSALNDECSLSRAIKHMPEEDVLAFLELIGNKAASSSGDFIDSERYYLDLLDSCFVEKKEQTEFLLREYKDYIIPVNLIAQMSKVGMWLYDETLITEIYSKLRDLVDRNQGYKSSREWLLSRSYGFRSLSWFMHLWLYVKSEGEYLDRGVIYKYRKAMHGSLPDTPDKVEYLELDCREGYLQKFHAYNRRSLSVYFFQQVFVENNRNKLENKLSPYYQGYCRANSCLLNGEYRTSEIISREMMYSYEGYKRIWAVSLLLESLVKQYKYEEAFSIIVDCYLNDKNMSTYFDLHRYIASAKNEALRSSDICYPIVLAIYNSELDDEYETLLELSFENYLNRNGYETPYELVTKLPCDVEDKRKMYFLENVCSQKVLESYIGFLSEKESKECRIKICHFLIDNGVGSGAISGELIDLKRQTLLKKLKMQVDSSRIYVDTSAFVGRDSQTYRSLFDRYMTLRSSYDETSDPCYDIYKKLFSMDSVVEPWEAARSIVAIIDESNSYAESNESKKRKDIFYSIVVLFREIFVSGEKGLNTYLSTRVRHGVLPSALREAIISEGVYMAEDFYLDDASSSPLNIQIKDIIREFSQDYDSVINKVNNEYLQVETISAERLRLGGQKSNRLFVYDITAFECYALEQKLSPKPTYDELVRVLLEFLWRRTEFNLKSARVCLKEEVLPEFHLLLEGLKSKIAASVEYQELASDYFNKIDRAKDQLKRQIDQILNWFTISNERNSSSCKLEDVVDIVSESLGVSVRKDVCESGANIRGDDITYFVDFFTILLENAISKSGLDKADLDFTLHFERKKSGGVKIVSSNRCSARAMYDEGYKFYFDAYGDEDLAREVVQTEGGSGFFKIWDLLDRNLGISHSVQMDKKDGRFFVEFDLSFTERIYWV